MKKVDVKCKYVYLTVQCCVWHVSLCSIKHVRQVALCSCLCEWELAGSPSSLYEINRCISFQDVLYECHTSGILLMPSLITAAVHTYDMIAVTMP
jgi:hypothetical protein